MVPAYSGIQNTQTPQRNDLSVVLRGFAVAGVGVVD